MLVRIYQSDGFGHKVYEKGLNKWSAQADFFKCFDINLSHIVEKLLYEGHVNFWLR